MTAPLPLQAPAYGDPIGTIEQVALFTGPMPTGVTVSHGGRIFVTFPKWGDQVAFTVAEIRNGQAVAYPDAAFNRPSSDADPAALVSVQSVAIDARDRLWILDTGAPLHQPTAYGGPKLVCVDLDQNRVVQTILVPPDVALPTTYLNDLRLDLRLGAGGVAFITDSSGQGPNGIIVVDLATGTSWRRLHDHPSTKAEPGFLPIVRGEPLMNRPPHGTPSPLTSGSDGLAIGADGSRLYYCPLASRRLYSVSSAALGDTRMTEDQVAATVADEGDKGGGADGLESDVANNLYLTNYEHHAILRRSSAGLYTTLVHDPRLMWPDTLCVAADGYLYVTANGYDGQTRFHAGRDVRLKPYSLFRLRIDARPVRLG